MAEQCANIKPKGTASEYFLKTIIQMNYKKEKDPTVGSAAAK